MAFQERMLRRQEEQQTTFANIMDTITNYGTPLLSGRDRDKLKGTQTTINHLRKTSSGLGVIKEVDFTILDGTTFMWNRNLPAAIAYGRTQEENTILLTGGIFHPRSLRRAGIEPSEADFFPELLAEIPGYSSTFDHAIAFRARLITPDTLHFEVGGTSPDTRTEIPLSLFPNNPHRHTLDIIHHLYTHAKVYIPRV